MLKFDMREQINFFSGTQLLCTVKCEPDGNITCYTVTDQEGHAVTGTCRDACIIRCKKKAICVLQSIGNKCARNRLLYLH